MYRGHTVAKTVNRKLSFHFTIKQKSKSNRIAIPAEVILSSKLHNDFIWEPSQTQSSENSGEDSPLSAALVRACSSNSGPLYLERKTQKVKKEFVYHNLLPVFLNKVLL